MSLLVLGLSHHTAPIDLLERVSLDAPGRQALLGALGASEHVGEAVVVSTCNRTEVYVEALTFHGAVNDVTEALITNAPEERERIGALLYLHFEDRAVAHTFRVASGLDSMAVGESQIRAQLRESLREALSVRRAGPALNALFQQALRVGKRVHTETDLDSVGVSLVDAGYARAAASLGTLAHLARQQGLQQQGKRQPGQAQQRQAAQADVHGHALVQGPQRAACAQRFTHRPARALLTRPAGPGAGR